MPNNAMTTSDTDAGQGPQAAEPLALRSNAGLGPLVEAAEKYSANYSGDDRQDIRCDVLNAFYAGAKVGAAERERCALALGSNAGLGAWQPIETVPSDVTVLLANFSAAC